MEPSSSAGAVPRWMPRHTPTLKLPVADAGDHVSETKSLSSEDDTPFDNLKKNFPFSSGLGLGATAGFHAPPVPPPHIGDGVIPLSTSSPAALLPNKGDGIYLTWKDLSVTVPTKNAGRRPILQGLTGYVQPGEVLAIMGPSGCVRVYRATLQYKL